MMLRNVCAWLALFGLLLTGAACSQGTASEDSSDNGAATQETAEQGGDSPAAGSAEIKPPEIKEAVRSPDVVFVPTPNDVVAKMLDMVSVTKDDVVYDLGCGDGRIVVTAAKQYGARGVGYDINPQRVKESWENVVKNKVEHLVTIKQEDIFELDLSEANVITLYLLPRLNTRLLPQLEKMKPGSRIVSHNYDIEGVEPDEVVTMTSNEDNARHTIYMWTVPFTKVDPLGLDE